MLKLWTVSWGVGALDVGLKNAGGLCRRCVVMTRAVYL